MEKIKGSPPQVRGKHIANAELYNPSGITPAGAGKTLIAAAGDCTAPDHPRRCGENVQTMRDCPSGAGITPAGAGKTNS